jgi:hypothetical protein
MCWIISIVAGMRDMKNSPMNGRKPTLIVNFVRDYRRRKMTIKIVILLTMLFLHIKEEDMQSVIAESKRKSLPDGKAIDESDPKYELALLSRAFTWAFIIHTPILFWLQYNNALDITTTPLLFTFILSFSVHRMADDTIPIDRVILLFQIITTWILYSFCGLI